MKLLFEVIKGISVLLYGMWVFENYLLGTGNRISTVLDVKIGDVI
ncbi:MAG: hypothetical protein RSD97_02475 [Lachnospiraceae bacterium]